MKPIMKFEHRIYPLHNIFGSAMIYDIIGAVYSTSGYIIYDPLTKISLAKFREIRKELVRILEEE